MSMPALEMVSSPSRSARTAAPRAETAPAAPSAGLEPVTLSAIPSTHPRTTFMPWPRVCVRTWTVWSSEWSCWLASSHRSVSALSAFVSTTAASASNLSARSFVCESSSCHSSRSVRSRRSSGCARADVSWRSPQQLAHLCAASTAPALQLLCLERLVTSVASASSSLASAESSRPSVTLW